MQCKILKLTTASLLAMTLVAPGDASSQSSPNDAAEAQAATRCAQLSGAAAPASSSENISNGDEEAASLVPDLFRVAALCHRIEELDRSYPCPSGEGVCWPRHSPAPCNTTDELKPPIPADHEALLNFCRSGADIGVYALLEVGPRATRFREWENWVLYSSAVQRELEDSTTSRTSTEYCIEVNGDRNPRRLTREPQIDPSSRIAEMRADGGDRFLGAAGSAALGLAIQGLASVVERRAREEVQAYVAEQLAQRLCVAENARPQDEAPDARQPRPRQVGDFIPATCAALVQWSNGSPHSEPLTWAGLREALRTDLMALPGHAADAMEDNGQLEAAAALHLAAIVANGGGVQEMADEMGTWLLNSRQPAARVAGRLLLLTLGAHAIERLTRMSALGVVRSVLNATVVRLPEAPRTVLQNIHLGVSTRDALLVQISLVESAACAARSIASARTQANDLLSRTNAIRGSISATRVSETEPELWFIANPRVAGTFVINNSPTMATTRRNKVAELYSSILRLRRAILQSAWSAIQPRPAGEAIDPAGMLQRASDAGQAVNTFLEWSDRRSLLGRTFDGMEDVLSGLPSTRPRPFELHENPDFSGMLEQLRNRAQSPRHVFPFIVCDGPSLSSQSDDDRSDLQHAASCESQRYVLGLIDPQLVIEQLVRTDHTGLSDTHRALLADLIRTHGHPSVYNLIKQAYEEDESNEILRDVVELSRLYVIRRLSEKVVPYLEALEISSTPIRRLIAAAQAVREAGARARQRDLSEVQREDARIELAGAVVDAADAALAIGGRHLPASTSGLVVAAMRRDYAAVVARVIEMAAEVRGTGLHPQVVRALSFAAQILEVETAEEAEALIEEFALPVGSWRAKYEGRWVLVLGAFVGMGIGGEYYFDAPDTAQLDGRGRFFGLRATFGLDLTIRSTQRSHVGIFVPFLDFGSLVSYPFGQSDQSVMTEMGEEDQSADVRFDVLSVLSPGLFIRVGLGGSPFVLGAGFSWSPHAREVDLYTNGEASGHAPIGAFRVGAFLAVDVTLFRIAGGQ